MTRNSASSVAPDPLLTDASVEERHDVAPQGAAEEVADRRVWHVDTRHADADDANPGTRARPLKSISAAALRAEPGDSVRVWPGVYRERVAPRRGGQADAPIEYESVERHAAVIKASEVWLPEWRGLQQGPQGNTIGWAPIDAAMFEVDQRQAEDWPEGAFPTTFNPFELPLNNALIDRGPAVDFLGNPQAPDADAPDTPRLKLGQVFVDGVPLRQEPDASTTRHTPGSFTVLRDPKAGLGLLVHTPLEVADPSRCLWEVTARPRCFAPYRRGLGHIAVRGFVMEHGATDFPNGFYREGQPPQAGILSTRGGHHWMIEHNVVRWGTSLGVDIGTEGVEDADGLGQPRIEVAGDHVVRFNTICDHGCGGVHGINSRRTLIAYNTIERNNRFGFTAAEVAGIKLHYFVDGVIEHNLIRDNDCFGMWLDNVFHRARVHGNLMLNNQGAGLFLELAHGPATVDHNVIAHTRAGSHTSGAGDGLYAHDVSGVTFAHNLCFFNAGHGLYAHVATDRSPFVFRDGVSTGERRPAGCSGWRVTGNLFIGHPLPAVALPVEGERSNGNHCDHNAYAGSLPRDTLESFAAPLEPTTFSIPINKALIGSQAKSRNGEGRELSLDRWQESTGRDRHSVTLTVVRAMLSRLSSTLAMIVGPQLEEVDVPVLPAAARDYFGRARVEPRRPGPFADILTDPRLASSWALDPANDTPGRGPFNAVDFSRRFVVRLWPKLRAADQAAS